MDMIEKGPTHAPPQPASTTRPRPRRDRGAGFTTISTSRPSNVKNRISRSAEKFVRYPRNSRYTFG